MSGKEVVSIEINVLAAMIYSRSACEEAIYSLKENDFFEHRNQIIFATILFLWQNKKPITFPFITNFLTLEKKFTLIGGEEYLLLLAESYQGNEFFRDHLYILIENSRKRRLIVLLRKTIKKIDSNKPLLEVVSGLERQITQEISFPNHQFKIETIHKSLDETLTEIKRIRDNPHVSTGVKTGIEKLDILTNGFQKGDLIILAARPSVGKTTLAINFILNVIADKKANVVFFSLEMFEKSIIKKMIACSCEIEINKLNNPRLLTDEDLHKIDLFSKAFAKRSIYIEDCKEKTLSLEEIEIKLHLTLREKKIDLVVIDHLQLLKSTRNFPSRYAEVSYISWFLKTLAGRLNVPILCLSQLSRSVEGRVSKIPIMSDLRESGAIEQDADLVIFLYREDYYKLQKINDKHYVSRTEVILSKNRTGPTGSLFVNFLPFYGKFFDDFNEGEKEQQTKEEETLLQ